MSHGPRLAPLWGVAVWLLTTAACSSSSSLTDYLPEVPPPTGEPQSVWVGLVTEANADDVLIGGTAATGRVGDYYLRNERIRVIISAPERAVQPQPYGGNIVDADLVRDAADPYYELEGAARPGNDRFGELGIVYVSGRTLDFTDPEILADGSGGGVAAIRFLGRDVLDDYINLNGMGVFPLPDTLLAENPQDVSGAVTYILEPGARTVRVLYTLFNTGATPISQPLGVLCDSGSEVELFVPGGTFGGASTSTLTSLSAPAPYGTLTGPGVAYGLVPRLDDDLLPRHGAFLIEGIVVILFQGPDLTDLLDEEKHALKLEPGKGRTYEVEFTVGADAAEVEEVTRGRRGLSSGSVTGLVLAADGVTPVPGARVFLFRSATDAIDDEAQSVAFARSDATGSFTMSSEPGHYLVVAEASRASRGSPQAVSLNDGAEVVQDQVLSPVAKLHYQVVDADGQPLPVRLAVIGRDPVPLDGRFSDPEDTIVGVIDKVDSRTGSSASGSPLDRPLEVPPGGPYRLIVAHGTEWDAPWQVIHPVAGDNGPYTFTLHRVVDTTGYVGCDLHQHSINSPDSPVSHVERVMMNLADGLDFFAGTDHDWITDYAPTIQRLEAESLIGCLVGVEATPFAYGHFNFYPLTPDPLSRTNGAIDWGNGDDPNLTPQEIWERYRDLRGATVFQVNHARSRAGVTGFQAVFDRAALTFDFATPWLGGDPDAQPVDNEDLHLAPEASLFTNQLNVLELWNGFGAEDTNDDGVREDARTDKLLRDWFNFLSFGLTPTGVANSDTHTILRDPALPRTLVRVPSDTPEAIAAGIADDVVATLRREGAYPGDVIMTSGPMIRVRAFGDAAQGIGSTVVSQGGVVPLEIDVTAASWAAFDTVELFVGETYDEGGSVKTALIPTVCFTSRADRAPEDTCDQAPLGGAQPLVVTREPSADGGERWAAHLTYDLVVDDVARRPEARTQDLWIVVRAFGRHGIFPVFYSDGTIVEANLDTLAGGSDAEVTAAMAERGVIPIAITNPIFVDVDGGGYTGPFAP